MNAKKCPKPTEKMNNIIKKDLLDILPKINLKKLKNKTLLVTGSNGLIGTYLISLIYLANQIKSLNAKVIGISKSPPNKTLSEFTSNPNFKFYTQNLAETFNVSEEPDFIIHAACYAQPKKFLENPIETIKLNTEVTEKLLKIAVKNKASFLFMSSAEVYGQPDPSNIPTPETYNGNCSTTTGRSPYMESKRLGETICKIFRENYGVNVKIARASLLYGPGISIKDERVMGNFLNKALLKKHINLLDKGEQIRTFCYITDGILMIYNILLYGNSVIYNVGGKETISIKQFAEIICNLTGSTFSLPKTESKKEFIKNTPEIVQLDINKIVKEFNLKNFMSLKQGLQNTIDWNLGEIL